MTDWNRVTKDHPCPICHKPDWCGYTVDTVHCMRISSDHPVRGGGGWIHRLSNPIPAYHRPPPRDEMLRPCFKSIWKEWRLKLDTSLLAQYAQALHVSDEALYDLGAAWAWQHKAWAFPMRDGAGKIVGIRLRDNAGHKWAVKGSRQGLFLTRNWPSMPEGALILEGPTDTAAALSIGFLAIGRPSCVGCEDIVSTTIKRLAIRRVIIVADNDDPGKAGAQRLALTLQVPHKIIVPPCKDMREWVGKGATQALVLCVANQQLWRIN